MRNAPTGLGPVVLLVLAISLNRTIVPLALGQETPTAEVAQLKLDVRKQVRKLNDRELAQRDSAEKALLEMGPPIIELLPKISDRMPAELKHRLVRIVQTLEKQRAEAAVAPTRLSLNGKQMPLSEVLASIEKQTGNKLIDYRKRFGQEVKEVALDLALDQQSFWPTLDQVLDQAKLTVYNFSDEAGLALIAAEEGQLPRSRRASYAGPFRLEATQIESLRSLRSETQQLLKLQLEATWEPRLAPISIRLPLSQVKAVDPDGKSLPVSDQASELDVSVVKGSTALGLQIPLKLPPRSVISIASLRGTFHALVPGRIETFRFEKIEQANRAEQKKGGATVILDTVRQNNDLWEVRIRVSFDKTSGALESHRGWIYENPCSLVDAKGNEIEHDGFETTRQTENEVGLAYLFSLPEGPKGLTFVYHTPAAILNLPVKYEIKNIPLP